MKDLYIYWIPYFVFILHSFCRLKFYFRYVKQPFKVIFQFNKNTKVGNVCNFSFTLCIRFVFFNDLIPRILCQLFNPQRYTSILLINIQDHNFDLITFFDHLLGMRYPFCPGKIRNMYKTFYSALKPHKCSIVSYGTNRTFYLVSYVVPGFNPFPGIFFHLFYSQGKLLINSIRLQNHRVYTVANFKFFIGMVKFF